MRVILAFATTLALASSAAAQTVPDRYGPARPVVMAAATTPAAVYGGRMLSWSSKTAPVAEAPQVPQAPPAPQPRAERPPAQADLMSRAYTLGAVEQPTPAPARPASLYDSPSPQAFAPQPLAPQPAPIARQSAPAPRQSAPAPAVAQQQQPAEPIRMAAAPMTPPGGGAPVRLYSLHRQYGMTPDPTPQVPKGEHYVLIGPPDTAQPNPDSDADAAKADDGPARPF